jgi:Fe-Mn family superoxide dismutase
MILENKLNLLTEKIKTSEFLISEMKRIGIEKLPYSQSSLKRFIDSKTMDVHYNGHYKTYVKKLNDALSKKNYGDVELEDIIKSISKYNQTIRNNAGGAFNHALFWKMLSPKTQEIPSEIKNKIIKNFGSVNKFKEEFGETAKDRFGSGWCWLILTKGNKLKIMSTPNQDNPLMNVIEDGGFPLLGLDLWEHAYYLRYQNKRDEYIKNFWDVVNWEFVNDLFVKRNKSKLTESVIKEQDQPPANNFILPNGKINPSIFDKLLSEVYPECTPKVITNYDLNKRIPNACFGKIKSSVCETDYGIIGGNYALSQMGGLGEWSAINYFDGNTSVGKQILNLYEKFNSEKSDFETWINKMKKTLFGDNGKFIKSLIKIVIDPATKKGTLDKGIERENTAERILTQRYKKMGITRFCDGDTRDKYKGQDMMTSKDNENKFIQVKSLYELYENTNENGETIFTFKNKNQYKKENINVFAFIKDENNYIFFDFINAEIVDNGNEAEKRYSYIFKPSDEKFRSDNLVINKLNESKNVKIIINKGQIKEMQKNVLNEAVGIPYGTENLVEYFCKRTNPMVQLDTVYCDYNKQVLNKLPIEEKDEVNKAIKNILYFLYPPIRSKIEDKSEIIGMIMFKGTFAKILKLALESDLPGNFIKAISSFIENSELADAETKKQLDNLKHNQKIKIEDLDVLLRSTRQKAYEIYENSLVGPYMKMFRTRLELNYQCNDNTKTFKELIDDVANGIKPTNELVDELFKCLTKSMKDTDPIKADLQASANFYFNLKRIFKEGSFFEVKMMDAEADSYLSEFMSIFKRGVYKDLKDSHLNIYNKVINELFLKISNDPIAEEFLNKIKNKLAGIIFEDNVIVPIKHIQIYWSNQGQKKCSSNVKQPEMRLSIRFKITDSNVESYVYNPNSQLLEWNDKPINVKEFEKVLCL